AKAQHLVAVHLAALVGPQHGDVPVAQAVGVAAGQEHAVDRGSAHGVLLVSVVSSSACTDSVAAVDSSACSGSSPCASTEGSRSRTRASAPKTAMTAMPIPAAVLRPRVKASRAESRSGPALLA